MNRVEIHPCKRCGIDRVAKRETVLCRDCVSVLKPAERKVWAA